MTHAAAHKLESYLPNGRLASLDYAKPLQEREELLGLIELFQQQGVQSMLEIGSRYGGTLETILMACPWMRAVVVDFPGHHFGDRNSLPILQQAIDRLTKNGRRVDDLILGPSSAPEVVERSQAFAPYDVVFIDADHSYDAVRMDFLLYSGMARRMVILHDIASPEDVCSRVGRAVEVPRFWREVKANFRYDEIVTPGSLMGIGVLYSDGEK